MDETRGTGPLSRPRPGPHLPRRGFAALALGAVLATAATGNASAAAPSPAQHGPPDRTVAALRQASHPLSDLRPLAGMVGSARIVGVGEATHSSGEFFRTKHRVFRHLVEERGFRAFSLEANWSAGLRLNDFVLHGRGDLRRIMQEEFQNSYRSWHTREYEDLLRWMRQYNVRHPKDPVHFTGNDIGYAGPELFDRVTGYAAEHHPALLPRLRGLYAASRPTGSVDATMTAYLARPLAERRAMSADVHEALALLERARPGRGADAAERAWTLQHARVIAQVGALYTHDFNTPEGIRQSMLHRDRIMAENTVWWHRQTGQKVVLSAHNAHVGYASPQPDQYPKMQGAFIRDAIGRGYVSVGFTFGRGSFNASDLTDPAEPIREFTVGPAGPGSNEEVLERVARRDYYLDLRTAPAAARAWADHARPTRSIGTAWPVPADSTRLLGTYDVLAHLPRITAADLI
ncbi:erythromycin esterase family protein [Streptomyces sp. NPDC017979]|uniref:erythromycin esterase family protein n=1 Tax=Streptomyces sp. NPDC017979 TaxID=3365024 RepID=UPI0037BAD750